MIEIASLIRTKRVRRGASSEYLVHQIATEVSHPTRPERKRSAMNIQSGRRSPTLYIPCYSIKIALDQGHRAPLMKSRTRCCQQSDHSFRGLLRPWRNSHVQIKEKGSPSGATTVPSVTTPVRPPDTCPDGSCRSAAPDHSTAADRPHPVEV